ncbi:MAG: hypothetical protein ACRDIY_19100 [Chloroflexota bacterium]
MTLPDGLADLIAETLRLRATCMAISQTIVATLDHVEELQRDYTTLVQRGHARSASPRGSRRRSMAGPSRARAARAIERARLEGAILLARTAAHLINNDLTTTVILDEMVRTQVERGERVDPRQLDGAIAAARRAARHLIRLQRVTRLEIQPGYGDSPPVLDLRRSRTRKATAGPGVEARRRDRRLRRSPAPPPSSG